MGRFYIEEPIYTGKEAEMLFIVRNPTDDKLEDVNVRLFFYDLGIRIVSNKFDIGSEDHQLARINWIVPERIRPGSYITRIAVGNDKYTDVKHIYLNIR